MTRVALIVLDSLPNRWVSPSVTPALWDLAVSGGRAPNGGRAVMSAATYPNHASFATGDEPADHGVYANDVLVDGSWERAAAVGPATTTIFGRCAARGLTSAAVFGDQHLVGVMGAAHASYHWPPGGRIPEGVELDRFRYVADSAVVDAVSAAPLDDADFVFIHLNEPDTAAHWFGPDSDEAVDNYRRSDTALSALIGALRSGWDDTVLFVVSDHDQETIDPDVAAIDVGAELAARGWPGAVYPEGTAAVIMGGPGLDRLNGLPGIEGATDIGPGAAVVWGAPGRVFGPEVYRLRGSHGSPRTRSQVAVVSGGHPAVADFAARIEASPPPATAWARWTIELLGLEQRR